MLPFEVREWEYTKLRQGNQGRTYDFLDVAYGDEEKGRRDAQRYQVLRVWYPNSSENDEYKRWPKN
jgi:hypothetical protein